MYIFHEKLQLFNLSLYLSKLIFQSWSIVFTPFGDALIEGFFSPLLNRSNIGTLFLLPTFLFSVVTLPSLPLPEKTWYINK